MAVNGSRECLVLLLLERIECDGIVEGGVAELAKQETTGHSLGQARTSVELLCRGLVGRRDWCGEPQRFPSTGKYVWLDGFRPSTACILNHTPITHLYSNAWRHKEEARGADFVLVTRSIVTRSTNASLLPRIRAGPWPQAHRGAHLVHHYHHQQRHLRESHHPAQQARHHRAL